MAALLQTWLAAGLQVAANAAQQIVSVYWTNTPTPLYGLFMFIVSWLGVCFTLLAVVMCVYYRDWSFLRLADDTEERRLWRRRADNSLTEAQLLIRISLGSVVAAVAGWYATPPDRTPPLIQSVSASLPIVAAIPLSIWLLGDHKRYCSLAPGVAVAFILGGIGVSLAPTAMKGSATFDSSAIAWSFVTLLSQAVTGMVYVFQQAYLIRTGVLQAGVSLKDRLKPIVRMLFFNQFIVLALLAACFWIDLLPWFGKSDSMAMFSAGTSFSFDCSMLGYAPGAANEYGWVCESNDRLYAAAFVAAYVVYLFCVVVLNQESAVFNTLCSVLNMAATSVFWLIPGS